MLKNTSQQCVAVLVTDIEEVLAGHTDTGTPGPLQPFHKVPFLFRHRTLLVTCSYALRLDREIGAKRKN